MLTVDMGEPVTDVRAAIERMRDQLPEEEKNGNVGKIITYMLDLLQSDGPFVMPKKMLVSYAD